MHSSINTLTDINEGNISVFDSLGYSLVPALSNEL